jgi:hypothetical protein
MDKKDPLLQSLIVSIRFSDFAFYSEVLIVVNKVSISQVRDMKKKGGMRVGLGPCH